MKLRFFFLLLVSIGISACSSDSDQSSNTEVAQDKIVNGVRRGAGELPQYVKIFSLYEDDQVGACTGTVIDRNAVLTAAHCISGALRAVIEVGDEENGPAFAVTQVHIPDGYTRGNVVNDIALLKTAEDIGLPILPLSASPVSVNEQVMIVGFGLEDGEDGSFGTRRSGTMTVTDLDANLIAAHYDGSQSNPCFGDSGGPLIKLNENGTAIAGIVSAGTDSACRVGDTTFFVRVDNYIESILALAPGATLL